MSRLALVVLAFLACVGCVGNFEEAAKPRLALGVAAPARDEAHCAGLDSDRRAFTWASWGEGIAAGATGAVAGALVGTDDATKKERLWLGISSGVLAGAAVTTTVFATNAGSAWAQDCSTGTAKLSEIEK